MRVACVQIAPVEWDPAATVAKAEEWLDRAAAAGVELAVFPEGYLPGYSAIQRAKQGGSPAEVAAVLASLEQIPGPATGRIGAKAREHGLHVVFGMLGWAGGGDRPCNASVLFGPDGSILNIHKKAHLTPVYEAPDFEAGSEFAVTGTALGPIGNMVCADFTLPETTRLLAVKGARLVCGSLAAWSEPGVVNIYLRSHTSPSKALDNDLFLVMCNFVGRNAGMEFIGRSRIIDRSGELVAEGGEGPDAEELVIADLDLEQAGGAPFRLMDRRRPELYAGLLAPNDVTEVVWRG